MKRKSTVITIDSELHNELKHHCDVRGMKIGHMASKALREYQQLRRLKKHWKKKLLY
jgi:hypothetical protein